MFSYRKWQDGNLEVCELADDRGTAARFVPDRGGILAEYFVKGTPVLYMDRQTLHDFSKNIRGGNPVLFPVCGPLEDNRYVLPGGRIYEMKQHGLARNKPWQVLEVKCREESAQITLALSSDDDTLQAYPFGFRLVFTYVIESGRITIKQRYINESTDEMPFYAGFHPYFFAPGVKAASLRIPSGCYFDIKTGESRSYEGKLDLQANPETNVVFTDLQDREASFERPDGCRITVRFDDSFRYIVLWVLRDKEFLCIEPWMGSNYDLNKGKARLLAPGGELRAEVSYEVTSGQ